MKYDINRPWETLDEWQKKVLETKGNIVLRSGRQVGKSAVISIKVGDYALKNSGKNVMVIAKTERQARLLFTKIKNYINNKNRMMIKMGIERPTNQRMQLKNETTIYCLPAGDNGWGIMGYTIDLLVADEAAFIPEEVWNSVIPTLTVTKGNIILLSTPFQREGYYYDCFDDPTFTTFHQSSEDSPRKDDAFLSQQKKRFTRAQYAQMYLGEFLEGTNRFFPEDLILATCTLPDPSSMEGLHHTVTNRGDYFLGVDIARMGEDDSTFEGLSGKNSKNIFQVSHEITEKTKLTDTARKIIKLNKKWKYNKIGIDSGGLGAGVLDILLEENSTKYKVIGLNNAKKAINSDGKEKKLLKEEMYVDLKVAMENGFIKLFNNDEIKTSLRSIVAEQTEKGLKIWGIESHIVEGLIRANELIKTKGLKLFCHSL